MKQKMKLFLILTFLTLLLVGCGSNNEEPQGMQLIDSPVTSSSIDDAIAKYFENMPSHNYMISSSDFYDRVLEDDDIIIVDIRRADDYAEGHVKGAVNMPWGLDIANGLSKLPEDKEIFIYCYTGQTAGQAVHTLNITGLNARTVSLGWNLGLTKLENFESILETEHHEIVDAQREIDSSIQESITGFYANLSAVADTPYSNHIIAESYLLEKMDSDDDFLIVSTRRPDDYASGHIENAINIPFGSTMFEGLTNLPLDQQIVVYCYTGQTAGQTVAALRLMGYDAVSLYGGMGTPATEPRGWKNQGFPLVTP